MFTHEPNHDTPVRSQLATFATRLLDKIWAEEWERGNDIATSIKEFSPTCQDIHVVHQCCGCI